MFSTVGAATATTAWTAVTFANSWTDYGLGYQTVQYRKVGDVVHVRGLMKSGSMSATAFTLPTGYRPPATFLFATASNGAFAWGEMGAGGTYTPTVGSNLSHVVNLMFSVTP